MMKNRLHNLIFASIILFSACKKKKLESMSPCIDNDCNTNVWISNSSGATKDNNGYWHVKWFGPNYFTVKCQLAELKPEYLINKVPPIECNFDSDYWLLFDTIKYITPIYSYLGWFNNQQLNMPIAIGNYTYTLKNMSDHHPPLNLAGYQIPKKICWDCPYTKTLFGTHSKYNYEPQQQMFLSKEMKGDTANVWIEVVYNTETEVSVKKNVQVKIVFD